MTWSVAPAAAATGSIDRAARTELAAWRPGLVTWLGCDGRELPAGSGWLTAAELAQQPGGRSTRRQDAWRLGRWAAKRAVAASLAPGADRIDGTQVQILSQGDGAPRVHGVTPEPAISLSHNEGRAVCAVGAPGSQIGCDLESIRSRPDAFLEDWFTPAEQERARAAAPAGRDLLTTVMWSAKEASLKAMGLGLRRSPALVEVEAAARGHHDWCAVETRCRDEWFGGWWRVAGGSVLVIVASGPYMAPPRHVHHQDANEAIGQGPGPTVSGSTST